jgi:hypothetical protein
MVILDIVDSIVREPAPVVCLDTCSLLDVLRTLIRTDAHILAAAQSANDAIVATPPGLWTIVVGQVQVELQRNLPTVKLEAERHLSNIDSNMERIFEVIGMLPLSTHPTHTPLSSSLPVPYIERLIKSIESHSLCLDLDEECASKALKRTLNRNAPGEQGGSIEDCFIIEHCLELASSLKARRFIHPVVFVSSNFDDYGRPGQMPGTLEAEFQAAGLQFAVHLAHARALSHWS